MNRTVLRSRGLVPWGLLLLAAAATAQDGAPAGQTAPAPPVAPTEAATPGVAEPGIGPGTAPAGAPDDPGARVNRDAMWPAPAAADWKLPCLVHWERSWDDALAVAKETGKPILVCVNMDGETASEHYAGIRYRRADTAALYEPYVCVIASVYRHNPRDYDEQGRRILCPRFGSVTCGEHIAIEPVLYEKFFDGLRVAPRHIVVELDGSETSDTYYAWSTDAVFDVLKQGAANRTAPLARGDVSMFERVASPGNADRTAIEALYEQGSHELRQQLLEAALARGDAAPVDLLRLAVHDVDAELRRIARQALAQSTSVYSVDLIAQALQADLPDDERDALIAALARLGDASPRARTLAVAHRGLVGHSTAVDVDAWSAALAGGATYPAATDAVINTRLENEDTTLRSDDATAHRDLAEALLDFSRNPGLKPDEARLAWLDAQNTAREAEKLGASGWRLDAVLALTASHLGDETEARARAESAVAGLPAEPQGATAMEVLALFAQSRQDAIAKAVMGKTSWPPQWLMDVHAAYTVLAHHPLGTDVQVASHYDFVRWLGGTGKAAPILDDGLARFPDSALLHERLRNRILEQHGAEGLESAYDALLAAPSSSPGLEWFAGYASFAAAEYRRRAGSDDDARAAYDRAVAHFDRYVASQPEQRASADEYAALALAGRARLALDRGDHAQALDDILASLARSPDSAATEDGLNISPVTTARLLRSRLADAGQAEPAARIDAALAQLDPKLLLPPVFERGEPSEPAPGRGQRGRR